jgi:heme exporter protein A
MRAGTVDGGDGDGSGLAVRVDGVRKCYGRLVAVDDVSFAVEVGRTVGLFGPNGAGKTTLLRLLAGLARPTAGTITVGESAHPPDDRAVYRTLGVVTHDSMLYDDLTARENLRVHAGLHGLDDRAGRCEEVLDAVGLRRRASERPSAFSHGLRKRLALARALLHDPAVLLLDEPYAGLDRRAVDDLAGVLDDVDDRTVLLTTHDLDRGFDRCDRALVVGEGRLRADLDLGANDATPASFESAYCRAIDAGDPDGTAG